ncbi:hypothetical protein KIPB_008244 [Kipferlia bialata]|uniref:BED-type domain-containing protein n=1 Tax=Kipferlia bialata TaxID=797122 RepID=A0A9K3D2I8_9EUKA|nr:hypothetical protein KIPB_008244 [Kipferlia bialata]|eukprot:g8244.t1
MTEEQAPTPAEALDAFSLLRPRQSADGEPTGPSATRVKPGKRRARRANHRKREAGRSHAAWTHFHRFKDDQGVSRAKCNYCDKIMNGTNGDNCLAHVQHSCVAYATRAMHDPVEAPQRHFVQTKISDTLPLSTQFEYECQLACASLDWPFSTFDHPAMLRFINAARVFKDVKVPSSDKVTKACILDGERVLEVSLKKTLLPIKE